MTVWLVILWCASFILYWLDQELKVPVLGFLGVLGMSWAVVWTLGWFLMLAF